MSWKVITIIIVGLLLFLVAPKNRIYAQGTSDNSYYIKPTPQKKINYYEDKKLSYQETEGLLTAGGWLMVAGLLYLEPEAIFIFGRALKRFYGYLGSEQLFQLINRLL